MKSAAPFERGGWSRRRHRVLAAALVLLGFLGVGPTALAEGIWISEAEILELPMSGPAWDDLATRAMGPWGTPAIWDKDSQHDVMTLAGALFAARTGDVQMRNRVVAAIEAAIGTEQGGDLLALSRNLLAYVLAADIIGYRTSAFEVWLDQVRQRVIEDKTLLSYHELRPNNHGAHAGASRIAIALYLGDASDLARAADVFHGWLGNREVYAGFSFGDLEWQADPTRPVAINPLGATRSGRVFDGLLPEEVRRCDCAFDPAAPFPTVNYTWGALQGATVQAEMLFRSGYPAYAWQDQALLRAARWLEKEAYFPAEGDDTWVPYVLNAAYDADLCTRPPSNDVDVGKSVAFTAWTHPYVGPPDADGDCVPDAVDNCTLVPNFPPMDCDVDQDGYGNMCDPDMNGDGSVSTADAAPFKVALIEGTSALPVEDMNCDGAMSTADLVPFRNALTTGSGPSGLACAGTVPCP
jgi:hypothetical protein